MKTTLHAELGQIVAGLRAGAREERRRNPTCFWHRGLSLFGPIALGHAMLEKSEANGNRGSAFVLHNRSVP